MSTETTVSSLIDVDQTASTESPFGRFTLEIVIIALLLVGVFVVFPTKPKQDDEKTISDLVPSVQPETVQVSDLQTRPMTAPQTGQTQAHQALIERVYDEVLSTGNLDLANELFVHPFYYHELGWPNVYHGFEAVNKLVTRSRSNLTDVSYTIKDMTFNEDLVIVRWTASGKASPSFVPETKVGQHLTWWGATIWRVEYGNIVAAWTSWESEMYFGDDSLN